MANKKWFLFYVRFTYERQRYEIMSEKFASELDLLVWASEMQIPKGWGQNVIVSPDDGIIRMPAELYERIDALRRDQSRKEALAEERALAAKERQQREKRITRQRKQKQKMEEVCST